MTIFIFHYAVENSWLYMKLQTNVVPFVADTNQLFLNILQVINSQVAAA